MIYLYKDIERAPKNIKWITNVGPTFNSTISAMKLTNSDLNIMKKIEGVVLVDKKTDLFKSKTGVFNLDRISTGLKALLLIRCLKRERKDFGINITECGPNVLDFVFEELKNTNIPCILAHCDILDLRDRHIMFNGKKSIRTMESLFLEMQKRV